MESATGLHAACSNAPTCRSGRSAVRVCCAVKRSAGHTVSDVVTHYDSNSTCRSFRPSLTISDCVNPEASRPYR
eukprot:2532272-Amphidinium_carterae.1